MRFSWVLALSGWLAAIATAHIFGGSYIKWQDAANEMFQRACSEENGLHVVGVKLDGHMVQFSCHGPHFGTGALFELPPQPDDK